MYSRAPVRSSLQQNFAMSGFNVHKNFIQYDEQTETDNTQSQSDEDEDETSVSANQTQTVLLNNASHDEQHNANAAGTSSEASDAYGTKIHCRVDEQHATLASQDCTSRADESNEETVPVTQNTENTLCIVSLEQLLLLLRVCRHPGCGEDTEVPFSIHKSGFAIFVKTKCPQGHTCTWDS